MAFDEGAARNNQKRFSVCGNKRSEDTAFVSFVFLCRNKSQEQLYRLLYSLYQAVGETWSEMESLTKKCIRVIWLPGRGQLAQAEDGGGQ